MKVLGISGSIRSASSNTALVRAAVKLAPPTLEFTIYDGLGDLPHFTPDLDDDPPAAVRDLRRLLRAADGILISTPEYAHGMPGSLKNALDWIVSSGELDGGKPAAAISASPSFMGGDKAHASLVQTLTVLGAKIPEGGALIVPAIRTKLDDRGEIFDPDTLAALQSVLDALVRAIDAR